MCSGCSGDYYSDFMDEERFPGEFCEEGMGGDMTEFHSGNEAEESQVARDFAVSRRIPRRSWDSETFEECAILVSESQITEIRVVRATGEAHRNEESVAWDRPATQRSRSATAKCYRTWAGARLLPLSRENALEIGFASFCLGVLAALVGIWVVAR